MGAAAAPDGAPTQVRYALVGPTASGKTETSLIVAPMLDAEIVCVDSMLVYRGMDVGTDKPTPEQRTRVPHHLLDVADPGESFSVARFQALARAALVELDRRAVGAFLVGGSGLYLRAVLDDLTFPRTDPAVRAALSSEAEVVGAAALHARLSREDPAAAAKIEVGNIRRTVRALEVAAVTGRRFSSFAAAWERFPGEGVRAAGVLLDRAALNRRIEARVGRMFSDGLLEEARVLADRGAGDALTARQAIGYAEALEHLDGNLSLDEARARTERRTKALSRRQMAWFRRDPRIRWFPAGEQGAATLVDDLVEYYRP